MTKIQEKIMINLFARAFKIVETLNYKQVVFIFKQVGWLNELTDEELEKGLKENE